MSIRAPGPRLLRSIPLQFIDTSNRKRRSVDAQITLIPFIDLLLTVVVFLLMSFSATGDIGVVGDLPDAEHADADLELAPIVAIDEHHVLVDGHRVADTQALLADARLSRIEPLVHDLETARRNFDLLHPHEEFAGSVVVQADRDVDFRALRKVLFSVAQAGYGGTQLAVRPR